MTLLVFLLLLIHQLVLGDIQQNYAVVNCTWPCPTTSDTCVLTKTGAQCQAKGIDQWVINNPTKVPVYTGAYSSVENSSCIPTPIPDLPIFLNTTSLSEGQSIIRWPIVGIYKALDEYLGNCNHGMFCSSTGEDQAKPVCRKGNILGSSCISSNQCRRGYCGFGICHQKDEDNSSGKTDSQHSTHGQNNDTKRRETKKIIKVVALIVIILGILCIIFLVFMTIRYHRRRAKISCKQNNNHSNEFDQFNETPDMDHPSNTLKKQDQIVQLSEEKSTLSLKEITPSMQQNVLQKELLKSHHPYPQHYAKPPTYQI